MPNELPPLDYQPDASLRAIRRGVRWVIALTLLNTMMLGASVFAPGINAFARQQWAAYQARQAQRATEAKEAARLAKIEADNAVVRAAHAADRAALRPRTLVAQAEALAYAASPDTLVFAEDFTPGTLPLRGRTAATLPAARRARGASRAVAAAASRPAFFDDLPSDVETYGRTIDPDGAYVFIHGRRATPTAPERLVLVSADAVPPAWANPSTFGRGIVALVLVPTAGVVDMSAERYAAFTVSVPGGVERSDPPLRLYAGQPDLVDASRWTIDYEFGDARGTIHGRLLAGGRVEMKPDGELARHWTSDPHD